MSVTLPFSNRYVFAKVMQDNPDLCKEIIERVLGIKIECIKTIEVESESVSIANRSVRFDVFLHSADAAFEVEMQTYEQKALPKRMRFYRAQLDRRMLGKHDDFDALKPVYVIFICTHDPFDRGLPLYTFRSCCDEDPTIPFDNGTLDLILNTQGDLSLVNSDIANLLQFIQTSKPAKADPLTSKLATAVQDAFDDEEWVKSMNWLDWDIRDAKEYAKAEGREEGREEGRTLLRETTDRLVDAMKQAGCTSDEILTAIRSENFSAACKQYGVDEG